MNTIPVATAEGARILNTVKRLAQEYRDAVATAQRRMAESITNIDAGGRPCASITSSVMGQAASDVDRLGAQIGLLADMTDPSTGITHEQWTRALSGAWSDYFQGPQTSDPAATTLVLSEPARHYLRGLLDIDSDYPHASDAVLAEFEPIR